MEPERSDTRHGHDGMEDNGNDKSRELKHLSMEKSRSSQREENDHRGRYREKSKISDSSKEGDKESQGSGKDLNRDPIKEDGDYTRDKVRKKENDREIYRDNDPGKDKEESRDRDRGTDKGKQRTGEKERDDTKILKNEAAGEDEHGGSQQSGIMRTKELEESKKKSEGGFDILSWKHSEKEKASKMFEEHNNVTQGGDELASLDNVIEGGAIVFTLKDEIILADGDGDGDVKQEVDIGEQKRRHAKRKPGVCDDEFEFGTEKKMLPQYQDPVPNEKGRFGEKKLEEPRRRICFEDDVTSSGKATTEEKMKFKKPKKKQ